MADVKDGRAGIGAARMDAADEALEGVPKKTDAADKTLEEVLRGSALPVAYWQYDGQKEIYIVYNEEAEQPANHADNRPRNRVLWWQVHLFAPKSEDFREKKKQIVRLLRDAGYNVTNITTLYEKETRTIHVVIPCHMGEKEE